jgi:hypothetical protein
MGVLRWELKLAVPAVEPNAVERIHEVLLALQPVAVRRPGDARPHSGVKAAARRIGPYVVPGKKGHFVERTHVGEYEPHLLPHGIARVLYLGRPRPFWLQRHLEHLALDVVEPTVIAAAQPAILDPAVLEGGAAMAAAVEHQADPVLAVAKGDEVFPQDAHPLRQVLEVLGQADRVPIASQELSARRARTHMGELGILSRDRQPVCAFHRHPPRIYRRLN